MSFFAKKYMELLNTHPIKTKTITASLLYGTGDFLCQRLFMEKGQQYNYNRTLNMMAMGISLGPVFHLWFGALDKLTKLYFSNFSSLGKALAQMSVDQTVFALFINSYFICGLSVLEGKGINAGIESLKQNIGTFMKSNWMIWPAAQMINFYYIPLQFRVLFGNAVGLGWNVIISYLAFQRKPVQQQEEEQNKQQIQNSQN